MTETGKVLAEKNGARGEAGLPGRHVGKTLFGPGKTGSRVVAAQGGDQSAYRASAAMRGHGHELRGARGHARGGNRGLEKGPLRPQQLSGVRSRQRRRGLLNPRRRYGILHATIYTISISQAMLHETLRDSSGRSQR